MGNLLPPYEKESKLCHFEEVLHRNLFARFPDGGRIPSNDNIPQISERRGSSGCLRSIFLDCLYYSGQAWLQVAFTNSARTTCLLTTWGSGPLWTPWEVRTSLTIGFSGWTTGWSLQNMRWSFWLVLQQGAVWNALLHSRRLYYTQANIHVPWHCSPAHFHLNKPVVDYQ